MPREIRLNYYKPKRGWSKTIEGKRYYFALGTALGPNDQTSYREAIEEYYRRVRAGEIPGSLPQETLLNGSTVDQTLAFDREQYERREKPTVHTIQGLVNRYLTDRELQGISKNSYSTEKYHLAAFLSYCNTRGTSLASRVLTSAFLGDCKRELLSRADWSKVTAKQCLSTVKRFAEWAYDEELIKELPRKLRKYTSDIRLDDPTPQTFTVTEVRKLWKAANQRTRLYVALALNCGYTQVDIATLEHSHINWKEGTITRPRNKTGIKSCHKLWKVTLELLKREATDLNKSKLVLLSPSKKPLIIERTSERGNPTKTDTIGHSFKTLKGKAGFETDKRGFKVFRKTGATMIDKQYPKQHWLASQYLAHSEGGVKKHYVQTDYRLLHEALEWLEGKLKLKMQGK